MPHITIFTPVYNRAHTLERLYNSLLRQTYKDFEWVVVDDGSTDSSVELIKSIQENSDAVEVHLIQNNHGGKHRAVNAGLKIAKGELFFMLDSDDWITDDALERVVCWENKIPDNQKCAGLCACMKTPAGKIVSKGLHEDYLFMPLTQMIKRGIDGDHADILFTEVFRKYPYPEIEGEYHIAPGVPFIRMANDGFNLMFFNEVIYIADYGPDGLTTLGDRKSLDNFTGYTVRTRELLHSDVGIKKKIKLLVKYSLLSHIKNQSVSKDAQLLNVSPAIALCSRLASKLIKKKG